MWEIRTVWDMKDIVYFFSPLKPREQPDFTSSLQSEGYQQFV